MSSNQQHGAIAKIK